MNPYEYWDEDLDDPETDPSLMPAKRPKWGIKTLTQCGGLNYSSVHHPGDQRKT